MKEVEILFELLSDKKETLDILQQFKSSGSKKTKDIYFYDPLRKDLQSEKNGRLRNSFRLRSKDNKIYLAYKKDYFQDNDEWLYSDEHETEVGDLQVAKEIIVHLGLKELVKIESEKICFFSPEYEIVFEEVKNLGFFLEIEKRNEVSDNQVIVAKDNIRTFVKKLGIKIGQELNAGKPELMLLKKISNKKINCNS